MRVGRAPNPVIARGFRRSVFREPGSLSIIRLFSLHISLRLPGVPVTWEYGFGGLGFNPPFSPCRKAKSENAQPRSGDRFIAWGVSPRREWMFNTGKPGTGDRPVCLSPLRGWFIFVMPIPGADAPG